MVNLYLSLQIAFLLVEILCDCYKMLQGLLITQELKNDKLLTENSRFKKNNNNINNYW